MSTIQTPRRLSNIQSVLLNLFDTDLADEDLHEIRNFLTRFLFKKAQQEADKLITDGKICLKDVEKASDEIVEHRGAYLKKIRNESHN